MLGGQLLDPASTDPAERRLLNVVEEMALASGVPVPPVYVLPEQGINAFAAGHASADAVIGITEGSMRLLTRDELQGVVAHEFSHVLNGDMRLNLRLIAVLHGILFIALAGRVLLESMGRSSRRSSSRNNSGALLFLGLGLALMLIGWVGVFFGRLIKAGVSREREYLADASAVQFTRNPVGLAGALRKIGALAAQGLIGSPRAETASHMFFAQAVRSRFLGLFATHPPLPERIRALDPGWNGAFAEDEPLPVPLDWEDAVVVRLGGQTPAEAQAYVDSGIETARPPQPDAEAAHGLPAAILAGCRHTELAVALALNLLPDPRAPLTPEQLAILQTRGAVLPEATRDQLAASRGVGVLELAMPALKRLDAGARGGLIEAASALAALDGRLDMREFAVAALLEHHLGEDAGKAAAARPRFPRTEQVAAPLSVVLSVLSEGDSARFAAAADAAGLPQLMPVNVDATDWNGVRAAIRSLRGLYPLQKPRVFKAFQMALGDRDPQPDPLAPLALALDCAVESRAA